MYENLDMIFLIDRKKSMWDSQKDTIGGFKSYIDKERNNEFNTKITTMLIDDEFGEYNQENQQKMPIH